MIRKHNILNEQEIKEVNIALDPSYESICY